MTLRDEDVGRIGEYVKPWLGEYDKIVRAVQDAATVLQ